MGFLKKMNRRKKPAKDVIVREVYQKIKKERLDPDTYAKAMADALTLIIAYEHIDNGRDGEDLKKWLIGFNRFADDVNMSGESLESLMQILKDECDFDLKDAFQSCMVDSELRQAEKKRRMAERSAAS